MSIPGGVVAYGGVIEVLGSDGSLRRRTSMQTPIVGDGILVGNRLLAPVITLKRAKNGRSQSVVVSRGFNIGGPGQPGTTVNFELPGVREPVNLAPIPGGVVAASRSNVVFLRWIEEQ